MTRTLRALVMLVPLLLAPITSIAAGAACGCCRDHVCCCCGDSCADDCSCCK